MSFPTDDILLGPQSFGRLHRLDGIIWHTGEEPGFTRDYAVKTAIYQKTNPGSYNFRVYDRRSDPRGVMLNVPWLEASGGINPMSDHWAPERFPFLRTQLPTTCPVTACPGPYRNPTMHHLQVSFVGRTADLNAGKAPANFLPDALGLIEWAESHPLRGPKPLVQSMHAHWQTNRSDCGAWAFARISPDPTEDEIVSFTWRPRAETWDTVPGQPFRAAGVDKVFTASIPVTTCLEQIVVVNGVVTTPMSRVLVALYPDPIRGPEVLVIPRTTLTNPRSGREGLPGSNADEITRLQAALDSANNRSASIKKEAATSIRKLGTVAADLSTGAEAAAVYVEKL